MPISLLPPPDDVIWEWLDYNPLTGAFRWKKIPRGCHGKKGMAGGPNGRGYISIQFQGVRYVAHRLAMWKEMGIWPEEVDHINGDRADNRIANLRPANSSRNKHNRRYGNGVTGYKGVSTNRHGKPYRATITVAGKQINLGMFDDPKLAALAYDEAARKAFGEYARPNFGDTE